MLSILDKKHTIAGPSYNRWLVPPAALAIHLSIGMAYGFSVFWLPMSQALGITEHAPGDWSIPTLGWTFTLFFVMLGSSAAIFGGWLERNGPRKAGVVAAICWGGGFFVSALGVYHHQILLVWLGSGVIGGCGLGLGYISPVSTLIKWFPDRRGMATGMAIMGFGGGAMIGSPLADRLIKHYASPTSVGVWETLCTLGVLYLAAMLWGAFTYRLPAEGWKPHGWTPPADAGNHLITSGHVHVRDAHRTPQFWLLWTVLCMNVSAGIGILGVASPMLQRVFGGKLLGADLPFSQLTPEQAAAVASVGAAFAGLLSLFNIGGRIAWASLSDHIGRKMTYHIFFVLGILLYVGTALTAGARNATLFVVLFCVILTMYGGGFATIPAYIADLFGTKYVGAIHGRLLTAWSMAGIVGPVMVNYLSEARIDAGVPAEVAYNSTLYLLAGLLFIGFIGNLLVRPVNKRFFMSEEELREEGLAKPVLSMEPADPGAEWTKPSAGSWVAVAVAWTLVGVPLVWGILQTVEKAAGIFR